MWGGGGGGGGRGGGVVWRIIINLNTCVFGFALFIISPHKLLSDHPQEYD